MNLLKRGAVWLAKQKTEHATDLVTLRRGSSSSAVAAEVGRKVFSTDDGHGSIVDWESRDYLIAVDDYQFDGIPCEPRSGDQIVEGSLASGWVYEVKAPKGITEWEWSDDFRLRYRVHTKAAGRLPRK